MTQSVNEFVVNSLINYPTIFKTREDVLIHALLVIGNGLSWTPNGVLVNVMSDKKKAKTIDQAIKAHEEFWKERQIQLLEIHNEDDEAAKEHINNVNKKISDEYHSRVEAEFDVIRNAETLATTKADPATNLLGYYGDGIDMKYGRFFTAPFSIQDDWLQAMHDIVHYISKTNPYIDCYVKFLDVFEKHRADEDVKAFNKAVSEIFDMAVEINGQQKKLREAEEAANKAILKKPPTDAQKEVIQLVLDALRSKNNG